MRLNDDVSPGHAMIRRFVHSGYCPPWKNLRNNSCVMLPYFNIFCCQSYRNFSKSVVKIPSWLSLREPRVAIFLFPRLASPLRSFVAYFLNNIKFIPIRKYFRANNDRFPFTECILSNVCHENFFRRFRLSKWRSSNFFSREQLMYYYAG